MDYYNNNRNTPWPFIEWSGVGDLAGLPASAVVDAGFIVGPRVGFDPDVDQVYLHAVTVDAQLHFDVRITTPGFENARLVFSFGLDDEDYSVCHSDLDEPYSYPVAGCSADGLLSGFLVVGSVAETLAAVSERLEGSLTFEPTTLQVMARRLLSLNVANEDRTKSRPPRECDPYYGEELVREIRPVHTCLTGPIRFADGYNVEVQQNTPARILTLSAGAGSGQGVPCEEIPTYPEEMPEEPGGLLSGGLRCTEALSSINGVTGKNLRIFSERGVQVLSRPDSNTVVVAPSTNAGTSCET